jgi:hypothetical protein
VTPNICISRRTAGVTRVVELVQVYGEHPRCDLGVTDLSLNPGPNSDDEFSLQTETREGTMIAGVVVDLQYRAGEGSARQGGAIERQWLSDQADDRGSIFYKSPAGAHVIFLFDKNCEDAALADAAHKGAVATMKQFLQRNSNLLPREFRPRRFSEGYIVSDENTRWRPCPRFRSKGEQSYPTAISSCGELYSPRMLSALTEGDGVELQGKH